MPTVKNEDLPLDAKSDRFQDPITGNSDIIPLLDTRWIEHKKIEFISYKPVPLSVDITKQVCNDIDDTELLVWQERVNYINSDLKWLLDQSHSSFWNHIIFNKSIDMCLDSFLKSAPRPYDTWRYLPDKILSLQKDIHRNVFMVYLRMATHKETKRDFFTPEIFGEILYENFLFDIPKILDLCSLFGGEDGKNNDLLFKMLENVFNRQPKYFDDLCETIPSICETLDKIKKDLECDPSVFKNEHRSSVSHVTLNDFTFYLYDTCQTLVSFLSVLPKACQYFLMHGYVQRIAGLYEEIFPELEKQYQSEDEKRHFLNKVKYGFVKSCRLIINAHCLAPLMNKELENNDEMKARNMEDFLTVVMDLLSLKRFLGAYNRLYSIELDISIIQASGIPVDNARIKYVLSAISELDNGSSLPQNASSHHSDSIASTSNNDGQKRAFETSDLSSGASLHDKPTKMSSTSISDAELSSMISHVKDLLPDFGEGFILLCLKKFNYEVEKTVNLILENNFPPDLNHLDRGLSRKDALRQSNLLSTRRNIHNDADINVHVSQVHKGKSRKNESMKTVLDRENDREGMKELILNFDQMFNDYEDEYDDTYDEQNVGAQDVDSADELSEITSRRPFITPRALLHFENNEGDDAGNDYKETKENLTEDAGETSEKDFRRNSIHPKRRAFGVSKPPTKSGNTERDRSYKDKHKAKFANHSRKSGAAKKYSKGMI